MPLIPGKSSPERRKAFEAGLAHLVRSGRVPAGLHVDPHPHPVYVMSLKDELDHADLEKSGKLVSWRYFAGDVSGEVVVGDVSDSAPPTVTRLIHGEPAREVMQANRELEGLAEVQDNDFELRLLRVPGAHVEGLWLQPPDASDAIIVHSGKVFGSAQKKRGSEPLHAFLKNLHPVAKHDPR